MKQINILYYIFLILLLSCKKENADSTASVEPITSLIIEYNNPNIIVIDINPDTTIVSAFVENVYSIDFNSDGRDDIKLSVMNIYGFGGLILADSKLRIQTLNSDCHLLIDSIYPHVDLNGNTIINQSLVDSIYPKVLSLRDTVNIHGKWRQGNINILNSGWDIPPTDDHYYEGYWWDLDEKYIGIKFKNSLGWIKIGIPFNNSIKVYEYAFSK